MALRTNIFSQFPWNGGVNLSVDPGLIAPGELVQADNIVMDTRGSRKKRPGLDFNFDSGSYQFTKIVTVADVSESLDALTFILEDEAGSVAFWFDVNNSGTTIPAAASNADRAVEITTVTTNMTAPQVAEQVAAAINADSAFSAVEAPGSNVVYAWLLTEMALDPSSASTSTFTVTSFHSASSPIINLFDFWYFDNSTNTKKQFIAAVNSQGILTLTTSAGVTSFIPDAGTLWTGTISSVSFESFNNKLIICVNGDTNKIKRYDPQTDELNDLEGNPVNATICREHLGRLFYNDPLTPDRLYYTTTYNHTQHNGIGDSGAIDISLNDGDPQGITAIFPSFKGELFIAKRTKMYRVSGYFPEIWQVIPVSNGVGCISHNSIAIIDQDDMFFASERGIHSLVATNQFGDFNSTFVSFPIQPLFNRRFLETGRITSTYIPTLNSFIFTVIDDTLNSEVRVAWLYNVVLKVWYRWYVGAADTLGLNCVTSVLTDEKRTLFFGSNLGRLVKNETVGVNDISPTGDPTAIEMTVRTGFIFPEQNPYLMNAFKRIGVIYSPSGDSGIEIDFQVDNYEIQTFFIAGDSGAATLGVGSPNPLVLGQSTLGGFFPLAPNTFGVEGYGRGFQLTIKQAAIDEDVEIQGFQVEYENAGTRQQTPLTSGGDAT